MIVLKFATYTLRNRDFSDSSFLLFYETRSLGNIKENKILSNQYFL